MNNRALLIAQVNAELRAQTEILKYEKEFENNGNQNQQRNSTPGGQNNNAAGNVPQQPVSG